jgi:hypothetical protein
MQDILNTQSNVTAYSGRLVISNADAKAAANLYATFYNPVTNEAWDEDASAMGSNATVTHANAAVACTDENDLVSDGWFVPIPDVPDGWYIVKFYDNAVPADTDTIIIAKAMNISGGFAQSVNDN